METVNALLYVSLLLCLTSISHVIGTGALIDPPARSVLWKYGFEVPTNYDYMRVNCGGLDKIREHDGKCGVCGDPYDGPKDNELNGKYGSGVIGRYYPAETQDIYVKVDLTGHEKGYFEFRICAANDNPVTQECLNQNLLPIKEGFTHGSPMRFYPTENGVYNLTIAIPPGFACERCVLQWRYYTGASWGVNPDGKQCTGCGLQEQFQNCADIRIGGSIPEPMKSNKLYKEMGWLDFKQQTAGSSSDKIKTTQVDVLRNQTYPYAASTQNSTSILVFDNITNLVKHNDGSTRLSTLGSAGIPILFGGVHMSTDPAMVSADSETVNISASNDQNNLIAAPGNSVLRGESNGKTARPDLPSPNFSPGFKFDKPVGKKQSLTENVQLLSLTNVNFDQNLNANSLDTAVSKTVENDIYLTLPGSSGDPTWPLVSGGTGRKPSEILNNGSVAPMESDGSVTNLLMLQGRESHNSSSYIPSTFQSAINSPKISERTTSVTFNSKMPRLVPGLKSEPLGPMNVLLTLDLTKMSGIDLPFVNPMNITTARVRNPRTGLTILVASRPGDSPAPLLPPRLDMVGERQFSGQEVVGLRESPRPPINKDLLRQSTSRRNTNIGSIPSASGSVQRGQNGALIQPSLAAFEGQKGTVSQQGAQGMLSVGFLRNASAATGVPATIGIQRTIGQISQTGVRGGNSEALHNNVPERSNPFLQNSGTETTGQVPQNNVPSAIRQLSPNVGPERNVMTAQFVAPGANGQLSPSGTQGQIPGLMVIPQNVQQPIRLIDTPHMQPNAPWFMTFVPWSTNNQVGATTATGADATFAPATFHSGAGTGMIPVIPRTPPMLVQSAFSTGLGDVPIPGGPLLPRTGPFLGTQLGPISTMTPLGGPGILPRGLPLWPRIIAPLRPQPFVLG